jgi:hypothetical protein
LAAYAQPFKIDYSAVVLDEKGLSLFGKPIVGSAKRDADSATEVKARLDQVVRETIPSLKQTLLEKHQALQSTVNTVKTEAQNRSGAALAKADEAHASANRARAVVNEALPLLRRLVSTALTEARGASTVAGEAKTIARSAKGNADRAMRDVRALQGEASRASESIDRLYYEIGKLDRELSR